MLRKTVMRGLVGNRFLAGPAIDVFLWWNRGWQRWQWLAYRLPRALVEQVYVRVIAETLRSHEHPDTLCYGEVARRLDRVRDGEQP